MKGQNDIVSVVIVLSLWSSSGYRWKGYRYFPLPNRSLPLLIIITLELNKYIYVGLSKDIFFNCKF